MVGFLGRNVLLIVVVVMVVVVLMVVVLIGMSIRIPTVPSSAEIVLRRVIYDDTDAYKRVVILQVDFRHNGSDKLVVRLSDFVLVTDVGRMYYAQCKYYDVISVDCVSKDVVGYGYTPITLAFEVPRGENPMKLVYNVPGVRAEFGIVMPSGYFSYIRSLNVTVRSSASILSSFGVSVMKGVVTGEGVNVTIYLGPWSTAVKVVKVYSKEHVDVVTGVRLPIVVNSGESVGVPIKIIGPNYSYNGDIDLVVEVE